MSGTGPHYRVVSPRGAFAAAPSNQFGLIPTARDQERNLFNAGDVLGDYVVTESPLTPRRLTASTITEFGNR